MHYEHFRQFHACFYRAVEATSVTPWAARALDRALAAVVVAAGRHLAPALAPEDAPDRLRDDPGLKAAIVQLIVARAPADAVVGGHAALTAAVSGLVEAWLQTADEQTGTGGKFYYGHPRDRALLHEPLDPLLDSLAPEHRRFVAGRSMRDVEHATPLKIVDAHGNELR